MQGLRIINIEGLAPSAEEIDLAHRVANRYRDHQVGTVNFTDTSTGIYVRYHPFKLIAFTQSSNKVYFGYDQKVEFKCPCRAIQLIETSTPGQPSIEVQTTKEFFGSAVTDTSTVIVKDSLGNVVQTITGTATQTYSDDSTSISWSNFADGYIIGKTLITTPGGGGQIQDGISGWPMSARWNTISGSWSAGSGSITATSLGYEELVEAAIAEANPRAAVFLTDGTELASAPQALIPTSWGEAYVPTFLYNYTADNIQYNGGDYAALFSFVEVSPGNTIIVDGGILEFIPPEDTCYIKRSAPAYPEPTAAQEVKDQWAADWASSQEESLSRMRSWRKKCSDGRISILRNGILPPEFDYFVKRYHPRSLKLRRNIPMQVVSQIYSLISDVTTIEPTIRTRVYEGVVTLQYTNTDENGGTNQVVETFTGNLTHLLTTHTEAITEVTTTSNTYTYSNFPMLSNTTGDAYPLPGSPPEHPYQIAFREINAIIRDSSQYPLFLEANGTVVQSDWYANDKYAAANYIQSDYNPPIPQSSDNVALTHPQFIYDYIEASKPIEFETVDGIKQPVTPSTNWLSSRLTDKEIVTIIPLSFTTNEGEERGMFPYTTTPTDSEYELLTNIKLYGFARFQFNYATSTFSFKDWTEFTAEGKVKVSDSIEHSFNDEINPTALTIGDKTYTLEPIVIDCEEDWLGTNCVFIGDKTPWTDVKEDAKEQTSHIGNSPPEGYELTAEERLYKAIREAIK